MKAAMVAGARLFSCLDETPDQRILYSTTALQEATN